nr:MAG TPA: hypothetical protein [Bacteriophage sp.]
MKAALCTGTQRAAFSMPANKALWRWLGSD